MRTAQKLMSVEEYIQYELKSERRHEYINGQLFEMPGEKKLNNRIALAIAMLLTQMLKGKGFEVYTHDVKVAIPGEQKYYYPDVALSNEPDDEGGDYILVTPALVVEVVSPSSQRMDYADKFFDYTKIPSLQYYLVVEPEHPIVTVYEQEGEDWIAHKFTNRDQIIDLPKLGIALSMSDIYQTKG